MLWTHASLMVSGFEMPLEVLPPVPPTYGCEVEAAKYFHALDRGDLPLLSVATWDAGVSALLLAAQTKEPA